MFSHRWLSSIHRTTSALGVDLFKFYAVLRRSTRTVTVLYSIRIASLFDHT
jgi:hypothetical protein